MDKLLMFKATPVRRGGHDMTGSRQREVARENLVFSSGYGYPPNRLRAFLKSISRNMKTADVVLFYHDTSEHCLSQLREYLSTVRVVKPKGQLVRQAISFLPRGRRLTSRLLHHLAPLVNRCDLAHSLCSLFLGKELL